MKGSLRLGRLFGIEFGIHFSWLLVFGLVTGTLGYGIFPDWYPAWPPAVYWLAALAASLLFFASLMAHELGHSLVAQARGIPVHSITLFVLGGVAGLTREPDTPRDEFLMAIAGPAVSLSLAAGFFGLWYVSQSGPEPLNAVLFYLTLANAMLVVFNLIPGFPLDGGRVLHAALWRLTHSLRRATRIAAALGMLIGVGFIAGGLYELIALSTYSGIWLVGVGFFLQQIARGSFQDARRPRRPPWRPVPPVEHTAYVPPYNPPLVPPIRPAQTPAAEQPER